MKKWTFRLGWMAVGIVTLYAVSAMAGAVSGGSLDPPGAPGPTMRSLDELQPVWSTSRPDIDTGAGVCLTSRFDCVLEAQDGVLDRETGLVWQKTPSVELTDWIGAINGCMVATTGDRRGWRLPTADELRSLGQLDGDHPFVGITGTYWTATTGFAATTGAYVVDFADLHTPNVNAKASPTSKRWCVRAPGQMADGM